MKEELKGLISDIVLALGVVGFFVGMVAIWMIFGY